jgi:large subunit ribosomal protein L23
MKRKEGLAYRLLKEPHISEKATKLSENEKYVFKIYSQTNKSEIKKAIANLYGVAVKDVNIINIKTKKRLLRGKEGKKHGYKKAIVTLEKGHKIEILPH